MNTGVVPSAPASPASRPPDGPPAVNAQQHEKMKTWMSTVRAQKHVLGSRFGGVVVVVVVVTEGSRPKRVVVHKITTPLNVAADSPSLTSFQLAHQLKDTAKRCPFASLPPLIILPLLFVRRVHTPANFICAPPR